MITSVSPGVREQRPCALDPVLRERDERLESLKAVVGRLAHDFNNFLVPLLGYVTLIKEEVPQDSSAAQYAKTLETAARRTESFVDSILLAVRPQRRFAPKLCDFSQLAGRAIKAWQESLPATAQVTVKQSLHPCVLFLDENQWLNVFQQLLSNARFALATGGTLEISLEPKALAREEADRLGLADANAVQLLVRDNGFGMSESTLKRVCEPFFTTRSNSPGTGLGLTIVQSVVKLHGGQLLLESAEDAGTTVTIWLPVTKAPEDLPLAQTGPRTSAGSPGARRGGTKVLLVEDDPMVREVIKACLQKSQLDVCIAQDGREGLKLFQKHSKDLALVVSDITMPKMNGIELYENIRKLDANIRVILVSGDPDTKLEEALAKLGAQRPPLIKKPFSLKEFNAAIRFHLGLAA